MYISHINNTYRYKLLKTEGVNKQIGGNYVIADVLKKLTNCLEGRGLSQVLERRLWGMVRGVGVIEL